jgi:hypothetical protein
MDVVARGDAGEAVLCPSCDAPMRLVRREPVLFSIKIVDESYWCDGCELLTQRTVKRDERLEPHD